MTARLRSLAERIRSCFQIIRLSRSRAVRSRCLTVELLEDRCLLSGLTASQAQAAYGQIPLSFQINDGQAAAQVNFISQGPGYGLFLTDDEAVLSLSQGTGTNGQAAGGNVVTMALAGANGDAPAIGLGKLAANTNYFIGNDPAQWHTNVANYGQVEYQNVYPGINLLYYGNQENLEYDFQVAPGADPSTIQMTFSGASAMSLDCAGRPGARDLGRECRGEGAGPLPAGRRRAPERGRHVRSRGRRSGRVRRGAYDAGQPLTIDPVLSYSTYLGGNGEDEGFAIAVDSSGDAYVTGETPSTNFPTLNPFQANNSGGAAFVSKFNASGTLVYSTYLGGTGSTEGLGIAVDAAGDAYVAGATYSENFPTSTGAFQTTLAGDDDAFVTKLNPSGSALLYSTYIGGDSQDYATAIAINSAGNAYITGLTQSENPDQAFPTTAGALQTTFHGSAVAFVTELNTAGTGLVYSTFLGGSDYDHGSGIALDASGDAYVTGYAESPDFPTTAGAVQPTFSGANDDAFVTEVNPSGTALVYSTFLGGNDNTEGNAIAVDSSGDAYVTGCTESTNFPTTTGAYQTTFAGGSGQGGFGIYGGDVFVSKLNPAGTALDYSTYLGGDNDDIGNGIAVDAAGDAYLAGETDSTDFPTTASACSRTARGGLLRAS